MEIIIDLSRITNGIGPNPFINIANLFINGGWVVLLISLVWAFYFVYLYHKKKQYVENTKFTLFAIDVPKDNEQSIKAVEELFNTLHGTKHGRTMWNKYTKGHIQLWFSFEIVSIEGYIQFLIRTPSKFSEVVKSAVYAHYPDADITEVEDYMSLIPMNADAEDSKYSGWGMEYYFLKPHHLPLKTYPNFEHVLSQIYVDPLASLLEIMSKIGPGEFLGLMIMARPINADNIEKSGKKKIADIMGKISDSKDNLSDKMINGFLKGMNSVSEGIYQLWGDIEENPEMAPMMKMLTPGERTTIGAIENKIGKLNFEVRIKSCYITPKEKFDVSKGIYGIQGAFKQFNDLNALKAEKTKAEYFFVKTRRRYLVKRFLKRYTERNFFEKKYITLSSEEMASLYHFPQIYVRAPLIKKAETKTVEPPTNLPLEVNLESEFIKDQEIAKKLEEQKIIDLNIGNKQFESKFAKDKDKKKEFKKEFIKEELQEAKRPPANLPISKQRNKKGKLKPPSNLPFVE